MKKLLVILTFLAVCLVSHAQKYELYKCIEARARQTDENNVWSAWEDTEVNFIIRLCMEENKIEINNKLGTIFYINKVGQKVSAIDSDGDKYTTTRLSGYDEEGIECGLYIIDWPGLSNRNFRLVYADIEVLYVTNLIQNGV